MGVALTGGHQLRHGSPRHAASGLNEHLQIETIRKAPLNLAYRVTGESQHCHYLRNRNRGHQLSPQAAVIL
jgi:hypothetical protein